MGEHDGLRRWVELMSIAVAIWITIPDHQRHEGLMRLAQQGRKAALGCARLMGSWAMRRELAGAGETIGYRWALGLMLGPYAQASRLYDRFRGYV